MSQLVEDRFAILQISRMILAITTLAICTVSASALLTPDFRRRFPLGIWHRQAQDRAHIFKGVRIAGDAYQPVPSTEVPGSLTSEATSRPDESSRVTRKRKVALLIGFDGSHYFGSQLNLSDEACPAVENIVWQAMVAANCVLPSNAHDPNKVSFASASRTDRGVSAARFLISAKLEVPKGEATEEGFDADGRANGVADRLNALLPDDIRVFSVCKVTQKFRPRPCCNWREYEYLLPRKLFDGMGAEAGAEAAIDAFDQALRTFEGTHNFNNFCKAKKVAKRLEEASLAAQLTNGGVEDERDEEENVEENDEEDGAATPPQRSDSKDASKPSPIRGTVYACEVVDRNWKSDDGSCDALVRVRIRGQAFFYNQIRMMVGAALAVTVGGLPSRTLEQLLAMPTRIQLPPGSPEQLSFYAMAPGAGLLLLDAGFDRHPKQSIATDAQRAAALAEPPAFVLLSSDQASRNEAWAEQLRARVGAVWKEVPAQRRALVTAAAAAADDQPANKAALAQEGSELQFMPLEDAYLARIKAAAAAAGPSVGAADAAFEADATRAEAADVARQEKEARRRAYALERSTSREVSSSENSEMSSQRRRPPQQRKPKQPQGGYLPHRALLPDGFSTAVATHCRLPPGRVVADLQRGLCAAILRGEVAHDTSTAKLLRFVDEVSPDALVTAGSSERTA